MAKLIVNPTSSARREIPLARTLVSIGRDPSNDLVLPDAMVSRRHAVIEYRGSQYFIRDCNSSNGSLVNGDRVSERGLRDGDLVAIGTARLLFRDEVEGELTGPKVVHHPSAPRLQCPSCHADYRGGDLYCRQCGVSLGVTGPPKAICTSCGTVVALPARYCNACGTRLPETEGRPSEGGPGEGGPVPQEAEPAPVEAAMPAGAASAAAARAVDPVAPAVPLRPPTPAPALVPAALAAAAPPLAAAVPAFESAGGKAAPTAPLGVRFLAAGLDALIVLAAQGVILAPALLYWLLQAPATEPSFLAVFFSLALVPVALGLTALYYIRYWGLVGATPGKRLLGLVVQTEDGTEPIGLTRATVRLTGYLLSAALLGGGFLMAAVDGLALHDRLAGTRVVRRRRS